jgi:hypothetical protein
MAKRYSYGYGIERTATRWLRNRNWSYRGDNTKYKENK